MQAILNYLHNAQEELRKVSWPTRKETQNATILVIIVSLVIAAFLGALDYIFNYILEYLLQAF